MIAAFLLALAAAPQVAPPSDDILVTAARWQRIRNLRIVMKKDRRTGTKRCVVRPSSGDPTLDIGICDIYLGCVASADTAATLEACIKPPLTTLVTARLGATGGR